MIEKPVTKRTYIADATCAQDLARTSFVAEGTRYGESITVTACGVHALAGSIDVRADRVDTGPMTMSAWFGDRSDNGRCLAGDVVIAEAGRDTSSARAPDQTGGAGKAAARAAGTAPGAVSSFREVEWPESVCPNTMTTTLHLGKLNKGTNIAVHLWSTRPNDVTGAMLRITHNIDKPNVSDEAWARHLARREARRKKALAREAKRKPEPRPPAKKERVVARRVRVEPQPMAPPPAQRSEERPPRPSTNAEWISGYWHWSGKDWLWLDGRWRVPEADVAGGLTVAAPHGPPPPRSESRPPAPIVGAVWADGYWQWNGAAFVWVSGSWRIAPGADVSWQAPHWQPHARGVIFVPGRWIRRH